MQGPLVSIRRCPGEEGTLVHATSSSRGDSDQRLLQVGLSTARGSWVVMLSVRFLASIANDLLPPGRMAFHVMMCGATRATAAR